MKKTFLEIIEEELIRVLSESHNPIQLECERIRNIFYNYPIDSMRFSCELTKVEFEEAFKCLDDNQLQIEVIILDPPWKTAGISPMRGTSSSYEVLSNDEIFDLRFGKLIHRGYLFL